MKENATLIDLIFVIVIILFCSVYLYLSQKKDIPLIYEVSTETLCANGEWCMFYRYLIDGHESLVILYDQDGDNNLINEIEEFKTNYLEEIGILYGSE